MKDVRVFWSKLTRQVRLRIAGWLVRSLGCTTANADALLAAAQKAAELASYIEKSGEVRRHTHSYDKLMTRVMEVTQLLEGAVKLGDPMMRGQALVETFMKARWASMSHNQQRKFQRAAAQREMMRRLPPRPPKAAPAIEPSSAAA